MNHVLTVIASPAGPALTDRDVALVRTAVPAGAAGAADWLAPGEAFDLPFEGLDPAEAERRARAALAGRPVDLFAQAALGRRKALLVADMDSTMITIECIDELADFAGLKAEIAAVTERAMRGELAFEAAVTERVARLADLPESVLARAYEERVRFTPGALSLVRTMAAAGAYCALVSGGFTYFTTRVAAVLGFHENRANRLEVADGVLTGRVVPPILGAQAKLQALRELTAAHGLAPDATLAVGDGANDLPMIEAAGLGVAFHAKPKVAAAARARIEHGDLTALLYLQGYRRSAFAA